MTQTNEKHPDDLDFAKKLKSFLEENSVGVFRCQYQLIAEDYSLTWPRELEYSSPQNDGGICSFTKIERRSL